MPALTAGGGPLLSAIVVTPDRYQTVRRTIRHLRAQSLRDRMEVVLVAPAREGLEIDEAELNGFQRWRLVEVGEVPSKASGYAAGVRAASAPVVVFTEDHCYPGPGWAAALERAHAAGWAAVGPAVATANPGSAISWADFLLGYGPWLHPAPGGPIDYVPGHNSSYKREALLAYEPHLEAWLEAETVLHWDMRSRGLGLYLEPSAVTHHFNFSRPAPWLAATFLSARTFAARRVRDAGLARRMLYAAASPAIPLVRLRRCLHDLARCPGRPSLPAVLPALVLALVAGAAGEAVGYALGPGDAPRRVSRYEFHRDRDMREADRAALSRARFWDGPEP